MFHFELDEDLKILRIRSGGFWDIREAEEFVAAYRRHVAMARQRWGVVKLLVDARESQVQTAEVSEKYTGLKEVLLNDPRDRVAIVVAAALIKIQVRRVLESASEENAGNFFPSIEAAEKWLVADDPSPHPSYAMTS